MLVVINERCIQCSASKHTGTQEIPKCRPDYIEIGKPILELRIVSNQAMMLIASMTSRTNGNTSMNENIEPSGDPHTWFAGPSTNDAPYRGRPEEDQDDFEIYRSFGPTCGTQGPRPSTNRQ